MVVNKTLYQDIQCSLQTCPMSRISSSPSPPLCLDQERGGKKKDTSNKVVPNCLANFYIGPQCIHAGHCVQLMLAGFRLHRNFANSFNIGLILTIRAYVLAGVSGTGFLSTRSILECILTYHQRFHVNRGNIYHCHANRGNISYPVECIKR